MEVGKVVSKTRPDVIWSAKHDHIVLVHRERNSGQKRKMFASY